MNKKERIPFTNLFLWTFCLLIQEERLVWFVSVNRLHNPIITRCELEHLLRLEWLGFTVNWGLFCFPPFS